MQYVLVENMEFSLQPDFIISDYEWAAMNSDKNAFTHPHHAGCYFHLSKIWWQILQTPLTSRYGLDPVR